MFNINRYIHRDVSWLAFNHRVLQEARDPRVPLLERVKFLAIYSSNLNEFYRVRVANIRNLMEVSKKTKKQLDFDPEVVFEQVQRTIVEQQIEFTNIFEREIVPELRNQNIYFLRRLELDEMQKAFVKDYFDTNLSPFVQPILLVKQKIKPFLNNAALYLAVTLTEKQEKTSCSEPKTDKILERTNHKLAYAIVKIPSDYTPRFIKIPNTDPTSDKQYVIMLDDVVRHYLPYLFPGYHIKDSHAFKITRDAELYIDNEFTGDLIDQIQQSLVKRNVGPPSRFAFDREISPQCLDFLMEMFGLDNADAFYSGRYLNNFDFFTFPDFGKKNLKDEDLPELPHRVLDAAVSIFDAIGEGDHLLNFPYQSYDYVVRFFEEAANDPAVQTIKLTQYRVASRSRIMVALLAAVAAGKEVTVFVEVKARFDEESNLRWARQLQDAGATVLFSHAGIKVHAKVAVVTRLENGAQRDYCYLSTGNFNEKTARSYVDYGYFTANPVIGQDIHKLFFYLQTKRRTNGSDQFDKLLVGQFNMYARIVELIDNEILNAQQGKPARIILKLNSLEDKPLIDHLYAASQAGVQVQLIVRGICCVQAGVPKLSENITVISIIDRFLEHQRIYCFYNNGDEKIYLASADWMTRNMHFRIETAFPIEDPKIRVIIQEQIRIQLADNLKARIVEPNLRNRYVSTDTQKPVRAQLATYNYLRDL